MPTDSWITAPYRRRDKPEYPHQPVGARQKQWQPDVYIAARALAGQRSVSRIIDVGCGNGAKLIELATEHKTIGIDRGANLERARTTAPSLEWRAHDLQDEGELPVTPEELAGSLVINADVIEHLPDPKRLLAKLRALHDHVDLILLSTPERHLTRGLRDPGPPANPAHIQEWTTRELGALLRASGLGSHSLGLIRSHDHSDKIATIFVAIARSAELLAETDRLLIDLEVPPQKGGLLDRLRG
ncbi:MAG: methyltransferase domain-containing protein [Myxococcales bacterium]|nr:methyltransferase domain-containing protein [Myxococcales bacterium]